MVKQVLILKESELVLLIQGTVKDIQNEQYTPILLTPSIALTTNLMPIMADIGDWFYEVFVECDEWLDCLQNGLDAIAIIGAFFPGAGWVVSGVAGVSSALISLHKEKYGEGVAMLAFELFPITRIGKRVYNAFKGVKLGVLDDVMEKMLKSDFDAKVYKTFKGDSKKAADYLLKNVDNIEADVMKAVKQLKNNKAAKDLMKLTPTELRMVAKTTGTDYQNLKVAIEMMKGQAKNLDDYANFFSTWRRVAKEVLFIGAMITTGVATYLGTEWVLSTLYGGDQELLDRTNDQAKEVAMEEFGIMYGDNIAAELLPCRIFADLLLLAKGSCNIRFTKWMKGSIYDIENKEDLEILREYLASYPEGTERNEEIKRLFEKYAGYGTACLSKKWKGGQVENTVYLDYYRMALKCGADCCGTRG